MRRSEIKRKTSETDITLTLDLDGSGKNKIKTGIGFFDHMLTAFSVHSGFDLAINCKGDLDVDGHHTIEDVGIAMGKAFAEAGSDKAGIGRYGSFTIPMDESLASCVADVGGRAYLMFAASFSAEKIGDMETQMIKEFFRAFVTNAHVTLHINLMYGENDHHKCEAIFKSFAHAMKAAYKKNDEGVLSTKGMLE